MKDFLMNNQKKTGCLLHYTINLNQNLNQITLLGSSTTMHGLYFLGKIKS